MPTIALPRETWRAIVDALRANGVPYQADHTVLIEGKLYQHDPGQVMVSLTLSDDVYLRSFNWARWKLGIPLPPRGLGRC